jgi:hypothetical protein
MNKDKAKFLERTVSAFSMMVEEEFSEGGT